MSAPMLDTYREVITPEGVPLHLPAAGPVPRALAWAIDFVIRVGALMLLSIPLTVLGEFGRGLYLGLMFLLMWAYTIVQEALWGRTVGKRVLGLRVVAQDGAPIGWMAAITRNLLRTVDMLPFAYALGLLSSLFDRNGRRLGDLVAGTVVVHDSARPLPGSVAIDTVLAPPQPLQPAEQAAIIAFAERAPRLSGPRQQELAAVAAPISGGQGQVGVLRLYAMANWLLGRR
ncbi:RDD family protein [Stenotrophomonas sp. VV52]|uniref:RDD family protein n=1 Tax=Stenotrophomonas sp. VV52 TaxID=2066958 RepID=UPI000C9E5F26|nr:RDD family protein [Stenotrophomonas sp. VV52]